MDPFTPSTGAGVLSMQLNVSGSTQYGEAFALRDTRQDGYASGKLNEISIDTSGVVLRGTPTAPTRRWARSR